MEHGGDQRRRIVVERGVEVRFRACRMLEGTGSQFGAAPAAEFGQEHRVEVDRAEPLTVPDQVVGFQVAVCPLGRQQSRGQRVEGRRESCDEGFVPVRCGTVQRAGERLALDPVVHDDIRPHALRRGGVEEEFRRPEPVAVDRFEMAVRAGVAFQQAVAAVEPDAENHRAVARMEHGTAVGRAADVDLSQRARQAAGVENRFEVLGDGEEQGRRW